MRALSGKSYMRHEAAYRRKANFWEDVGIGVAVFAAAAALVVSAIFISAAVGPAVSAPTTQIAQVQSTVRAA